jgi:uncharacterized protein (TIGR03083 family)
VGLLEQFDDVAVEFSRLVAATSLDSLEVPTPCAEWTVRLLLNHVITGTQWYACVIEGRATPDRSIDQVRDDPTRAGHLTAPTVMDSETCQARRI